VTVDLPISDPGLGAAEYADVVAGAMPDAADPVVVGHSMAGLVLPLVADRRPVRRLVFIAAFLPRAGMSANDQRRAEPIDGTYVPTAVDWVDLGDNVWAVGPETARELFFNDLEPDLARWAVARLRPQAYRVFEEPSPLGAWPDVPSSYIVCRSDRSVSPDWARHAALDRLGVEPVEIDGGHSPFLTRPVELARIVSGLASG
jgi:pimeloyl-ACP methyl ester carboxylesterase